MRVNVIRLHDYYPLGEQEVTDERGIYLIRLGIAEEVTTEKEIIEAKKEKKEFKPVKEKVERKKRKK